MQDHENKKNLARLQWACRRGMLELDVLLGNFLAEAYPSLSSADQELFVQLLECSDPEVYAWLLGQEQPTDPGLITITELIRHHAKTRI